MLVGGRNEEFVGLEKDKSLIRESIKFWEGRSL